MIVAFSYFQIEYQHGQRLKCSVLFDVSNIGLKQMHTWFGNQFEYELFQNVTFIDCVLLGNYEQTGK